MIEFEAQTFQSLFPLLVKNVMNKGKEVRDERGSLTKELMNVIWRIHNPEKSEVPEGLPFGENMINEYDTQLLDPETHGFDYTYGNRLRRFPQDVMGKEMLDGSIEEFSPIVVDQVQYIINKLHECKNSRRAVATTWYPRNDCFETDVPCLIMVDFKIRDDKLLTTTVFRSNDLFGAVTANSFAIRELARHIADKLNIKIGTMTNHSISLHIYKNNWEEANGFIRRRN